MLPAASEAPTECVRLKGAMVVINKPLAFFYFTSDFVYADRHNIVPDENINVGINYT